MELNVLQGVMQGAQAVSEFAAGALVASVWQGLVLAAVIWLCLKMLPRTGAATRFGIWMRAFGVLAVLPLVRLHPVAGAAAGVLARGPLVHVDARWSVALTAVWLGVSLYRLAGLVVNGWKLWSVWRRAEVVEVAEGVASLLVDGSRRVQLCVSDEVERPSLIGFFSPRVVVPRWLFARLSEVELQQIVMHEMEHLRRRDDWINLVQKVGLAVFPLNPVLVWIERRLCLERELACDAGVIRATGAPKAYATCLTTLAERSMELNPARRAAALALGAWERRSQLAERVHGILRREKMLSPVQAGAVMSVAVVGLVAGAAELSRCPQLISFAAPAPLAVATTPSRGTSVPSAGMQDVVYRDGAASMLPRETLLKASMDSAAPVKPAARKAKAKKVVKAPVPSVLRTVSQRQGGVRRVEVSYSWSAVQRSADVGGARVTFTVLDGGGGGFAAVPTPDGWLVFQL